MKTRFLSYLLDGVEAKEDFYYRSATIDSVHNCTHIVNYLVKKIRPLLENGSSYTFTRRNPVIAGLRRESDPSSEKLVGGGGLDSRGN